MIRVSATQIRNNFAHYLNLAAYTGEQVVVEKMGKPIVALIGIIRKKDKKRTKKPSFPLDIRTLTTEEIMLRLHETRKQMLKENLSAYIEDRS